MVEAGGEAMPCTACTLDDPNASHFGTRLRAYALKTIINRFLNAHTLSGFDSPHCISKQNKKRTPCGVLFTFGGGGGSRTPVRKRIHKSFSGRSLMFTFPRSVADRRATVLSSFILHAALKALRGHVHHCMTSCSRAVVLPGKMAAC